MLHFKLGSGNLQIYQFFNLFYYSTTRKVGINYISLNGQLNRYSDPVWSGKSGNRKPLAASFLYLPHWLYGPHWLLYTGYWITPGSKMARAWCWRQTTFSPKVTERVQLYIYSLFWAQWPVLAETILVWERNVHQQTFRCQYSCTMTIRKLSYRNSTLFYKFAFVLLRSLCSFIDTPLMNKLSQ